MREGFVSLAALVHASGVAPGPAREPEVAPPVAAPRHDTAAKPERENVVVPHMLALVRAAAEEAFERGAARLLESLAHEVLGRELALRPADTAELIDRALRAFAEHEPVALGLSPADAGRIDAALPVRVEPELTAGDLVVYVRDGSFESHTAYRLQHALSEAACTLGDEPQ